MGCEWEVTIKSGEHVDGKSTMGKKPCGQAVTNLATRDDFRRPIGTCTDHVDRARKYGFTVERGHK